MFERQLLQSFLPFTFTFSSGQRRIQKFWRNDVGYQPPSSFIANAHNELTTVISRGNARGNAIPIVKVFKNALQTALWTIFRPKMHQIVGFCIFNLNSFRGWYPNTHGPSQKHLGVWTQKPISAWLASVFPLFLVLRNDHWTIRVLYGKRRLTK